MRQVSTRTFLTATFLGAWAAGVCAIGCGSSGGSKGSAVNKPRFQPGVSPNSPFPSIRAPSDRPPNARFHGSAMRSVTP